MPRYKTLEFANLTLTFGKDKVLADLLQEVVLPAFLDLNLTRPYGETTYFFNEVRVIDLGTKRSPEPAIVGTFIKDTVMRREQLWNKTDKSLESKPATLRNSPSSTFVLILATHKLLFLHETSLAPGYDAFKGTLFRFLKRKYFEFIDKVYSERRDAADEKDRGSITKKLLYKEFLPPELSITPLPSEGNLLKHLDKFETLQAVQVELTRVNAEGDNDPFFEQMRDEQNSVGADKAIFYEEKKTGLDKEAVGKQLGTGVLDGNAKVKLSGRAAGDQPLDVTNDDLKLRLRLNNLPEPIDEKAKEMFRHFNMAVSDKTILVGKVDEAQAKSIRDNFAK